jgi:hypothetical protein
VIFMLPLASSFHAEGHVIVNGQPAQPVLRIGEGPERIGSRSTAAIEQHAKQRDLGVLPAPRRQAHQRPAPDRSQQSRNPICAASRIRAAVRPTS